MQVHRPKIIRRHKAHIGSVGTKMAYCREGCCHIVNQDHVAIRSPQGRDVSEVGSQLSASMRSSELTEVGCQCNIMFGIEDMQFHDCKITISEAKNQIFHIK